MMREMQPKVYAVKNKNDKVRAESRSGGIFTALSDEILYADGVVYGCVLTRDFLAIHARAETFAERDCMRGSKYIQSRLCDTYKNVAMDLKNGRKVLFSGTSCQVAGLRKYLNIDYENLFCVDIICHGVPSSEVWREYLLWQERKHGNKVAAVDFRNKKDFGWKDHVETLIMKNGDIVNCRVFTKLFYGHNILRPSCYKCPYKAIMHPGDITIGDYWGIEKAASEFNDNKGVSLVLINNIKGKASFEKVKRRLIWKSTRMEDSMQQPLIKPFEEPAERKQFWKDFHNLDFNKIAKKYGGIGLKARSINSLRKIKHRIMRT